MSTNTKLADFDKALSAMPDGAYILPGWDVLSVRKAIAAHDAEQAGAELRRLAAVEAERDALKAELAQAYEAHAELEKEGDELLADAMRYRWLRDKSEPPHNFYISVPVEFHGVGYQPSEVDAYIDAARATGEQQ